MTTSITDAFREQLYLLCQMAGDKCEPTMELIADNLFRQARDGEVLLKDPEAPDKAETWKTAYDELEEKHTRLIKLVWGDYAFKHGVDWESVISGEHFPPSPAPEMLKGWNLVNVNDVEHKLSEPLVVADLPYPATPSTDVHNEILSAIQRDATSAQSIRHIYSRLMPFIVRDIIAYIEQRKPVEPEDLPT